MHDDQRDDTNDMQTENALRAALNEASRRELAAASPELDARVLSVAGERGRGGLRVLPWIFASAAVALAALAWGMNRETEAPTPKRADVADVDTSAQVRGRQYVLALHETENSVTAQNLDTFDIVRVAAGGSLGGRALVRVQPNAIYLEGADGATDIVLPAAFNEESEALLAGECSALRARFQAGVMTPANLDRLGDIARFGVVDAVRLLETIAGSDTGLRAAAEATLTARKGFSAIQKLVATACDGADRFRRQAISSLCLVEAPLAVDCLKTIVASQDRQFAEFVVRSATAGGATDQALTVLRHAAEQSPDPDVRMLARQSLDTLLAGNR